MPKLPKIGMRIVKSALAVFVCLLIDRLRGGMPIYAAIAAILCMQPDVANSLKTAANRVIGTLVGGLAGTLALTFFVRFLPDPRSLLRCFLTALLIVALMYVTVLLKKTSATYITCVVFLAITVSHGGDLVPYVFALNRVADTLLGIGVSLGVNLLPFWRPKPAPPDPPSE